MLRDLRVQNFGLIEELEVQFDDGLNVVTGETGAGKSMLMAALELASGGKATAEAIRGGCDEAVLEAVYELPGGEEGALLEEAGVPVDGELSVRRTLQRNGRNRVWLNGTPTTLGVLAGVGARLLHVYGQGDQQSLRHEESHLRLIDAFAGHDPLREEMREAHREWSDAAERHRRLVQGRDASEARAEILRFQLREIEAARLVAGEEEELRRERQIVGSAERLLEAARLGESLLYEGEGAAAAAAGRVARELRELERLDPRLAEIAGIVEEAASLSEEAGAQLRDYAAHVDVDPGRLDEIEERLALVERLKRKYGGSVEDVIATGEAAQAELADLELGEDGLRDLEKEVAEKESRARAAAKKLSASRRRAAKALEAALAEAVGGLGMKHAAFEVRFAPDDDAPLTSSGIDRVALWLSANPGEALGPLSRVASGGELSRIMLAIQAVALEQSDRSTVIFDEVDTGIGGAVAEVVGSRLSAIAKGRQVLCISHLPQIAAFADQHYVVEKETARGRTRSRTRRLETAEREEEIARMLGGAKITAAVRQHARQLLRIDR